MKQTSSASLVYNVVKSLLQTVVGAQPLIHVQEKFRKCLYFYRKTNVMGALLKRLIKHNTSICGRKRKNSQQYIVFKKIIIIFCLRNSVLSLAMGANQHSRHTQGFLMLEKYTCTNMEG